MLLVEYGEFVGASVDVGFVGVGACGLDGHVVYLEGEDGESVDCPGGAFGVYGGVGGGIDVAIFVEEVGVDVLDHIGTVLVGLVYTAFDL